MFLEFCHLWRVLNHCGILYEKNTTLFKGKIYLLYLQ
uniref:Uncharacterized protein n=1 Tax=Arundo donax TaxID=35708 RepID=A0A0A9FMX9_ARUDO